MASSAAEGVFAPLADGYEEAHDAAVAGDLERARRIVDDLAPLLADLPAPDALAPHQSAARERALAAFTALADLLLDERDRTVAALERGRKGKRVLDAYDRKVSVAGIRLERDG